MSEQKQEFEAISQRELIKKKFFRNKLAVAGGIVLIILYLSLVIFPDFFATNHYRDQDDQFMFGPPQRPRFIDQDGSIH